MSTTSELTWGRLHVAREGGRHRVRLYAYTKSEQARTIELTKTELVALIDDATTALAAIEQRNRQDARDLAGRVESDLTGADAGPIAAALRRLLT